MKSPIFGNDVGAETVVAATGAPPGPRAISSTVIELRACENLVHFPLDLIEAFRLRREADAAADLLIAAAALPAGAGVAEGSPEGEAVIGRRRLGEIGVVAAHADLRAIEHDRAVFVERAVLDVGLQRIGIGPGASEAGVAEQLPIYHHRV